MKKIELAKQLGLSMSVFYRQVARGMPTDSVESATAWREKTLRPRYRPESPEHKSVDGQIDYHEARRMREVAEAKIAELKLAEIDGTLIERETVRIVVFEILRGLRDTLTSMSRRVSAAVAVIDDAGECERLIKSEIDRALESVITELKQKKIH